MSFKLGDKVVTNPELREKTWTVGAMKKIHIIREVMTITNINGGHITCKAKDGVRWLYHKSELIPYDGFFNEVEKL